MNYDEENLKIMKKCDNYNKWLYNQICKSLGKNVLEIGSGVGSMTNLLLNKRKVTGTEINKKYFNFLKKKFKYNKNFKILFKDISKKSLDKKFDTVVCINVLEHIKDDFKAIENMKKSLNKKGKIILIVPAFKALFGTIDIINKHHRRYSKKRLTNLLKKNKILIKKIKYMNIPGFFGWFYHGKIKKLKIHQHSELWLFNKLVPFFEFFEKIFPVFFGLSLIVIGEKKC